MIEHNLCIDCNDNVAPGSKRCRACVGRWVTKQRGEYWREAIAEGLANREPRWALNPCSQCGDRYKAINWRTSKFCSPACRSKDYRERMWARVNLRCDQCGTPFKVKPNQRPRAKYCSDACRGKAFRFHKWQRERRGLV